MLNALIEKTEEVIAEKICNRVGSVSISVANLRRLTQAAKLLCNIHAMADEGDLDGVDLHWMVEADELVLGEGQGEIKSPSMESIVLRPCWPEGLEAKKVYRFQCDDCCPAEATKDFTVVVSDDGDVWLGMLEINDKHTSKPYRNPSPTVRCRTGIGGGRHKRTRQALLWLARAIQLDNEELGIKS